MTTALRSPPGSGLAEALAALRNRTMHLARGQLLVGRFALKRSLGAGGMGEVWLAEDLALVRETALKLVPQGDPSLTELLRREHRRTRTLEHPNIVRVYDLFETEAWTVFSMEYLSGPNLDAFLRRPAGMIVAALLSVVAALDHAHGHGVVHRDLKSSNVIHGADGRPRLTDFGLAAAHSLRESSEPGSFAGGSRKAMSPQQLSGAAAHPSDDVYGLGALAYELLAGTPPLGPDPSDEAICERAPEPLSRLVPLAPPALTALVDSMLAKDRNRRPASMAELLRALAPHASAPLTLASESGAAAWTRAPSARPQAPPPTVRPRRVSSTTIGAAVLVALAAGVLTLLPRWLAGPGKTASSAQQTSAEAAADPAAASAAGADESGPSRTDTAAVSRADLDEPLAAALQRQERLQALAVEAWAPDEWRDVSERLADADHKLVQQAWPQSRSAYAAAISAMDGLLERAPQELERQIQRGATAIEAGDPDAAVRAFEIAAQMAPEQARTQQGLRRAHALTEVLERVQEGAALEARGDLETARATYARAAELDPAWRPAAQALGRVSGVLDQRVYEASLSRGFERLAAADYRAAREAFRSALERKPGSAEAKAGLAEIDQRSGTRAIETERDRARELERSERWAQAAESYRKILAIDPQLAFASEGLARSEQRAALEARLGALLSNAAQLYDEPEVLERARSALATAQATPEPGPGLRRQQAQLAAAIASATTPIRVVLESDDQTEVSVIPVGALGRFARRELELRPGTYTVVGSRDGYRDVRAELVVQPGGQPAPLQIRVEERIR